MTDVTVINPSEIAEDTLFAVDDTLLVGQWLFQRSAI